MWRQRACQSCGLIVAAVIVVSLYCRTTDDPSSRLQNAMFFNSSCSCQSLFTIGACGLHTYYADSTLPYRYRKIFKRLENARNGAQVFFIEPLHNLARLLPKFVRTKLPSKTFAASTPSSQYKGKYSELLRQTTSSLTYVPCKIHSYTPTEIKECLDKRKILTGRILKIAFVGDSQVRNLMEQMIEFLKVALNLRAGNDMGLNLTTAFLNVKFKQDFPVQGDGLELRLYWSTFLGQPRDKSVSQQGARDLLKVWAMNQTTENHEEVPDILYFDDGMWGTGQDTEWGAISMLKNDFDSLKPYLQNISKTTRLILRTQTPVKEWAAQHTVFSSGLDIMNQIAWWAFRDVDLWIWDSITPVYLREREDCKNFWKTGFGRSLPKRWACSDFQHPSKLSEMVAGNMIWNYVCNGVSEPGRAHCCT